MATLWSNILTHFTIYLPLNLLSFLILRHSFNSVNGYLPTSLYQNLKKLWTSLLIVVNLSSLSITMFMCGLWCWQLLGRTSEKDEQSDEAKEVHFFCYFSLTRTFLFILIFFGFLNCIYQAFTTDFYLLSFSLTTLYQLLKLHLVVRCQSHGLMNLWL